MNTHKLLLCLLAACLALAGCAPADPHQRVLKDRARWNVDVLDVSQNNAGTITIATRVSGPPGSNLAQLTVRVQLTGAESEVIESRWHTFDLSGVERGGPADMVIVLPEFAAEVFGAGVDMVLAPTAEERAQIKELQF